MKNIYLAEHVEELVDKAVEILRGNLSKEEMIELGEALDGGAEDIFLDGINEVLMKIAPEVFE